MPARADSDGYIILFFLVLSKGCLRTYIHVRTVISGEVFVHMLGILK